MLSYFNYRSRIILSAIVAAHLFSLSACMGSVELLAGVPEAEANEMLGSLLNAGIRAEKNPGKDGVVSLKVDGGSVARALDVLRVRGLPRERFAGMGDVFRKEGLISSPLEERVRYLYALSQELANTISKIDGVITARVHVVLPERGASGEASTPSSAAVFIKSQEGFNLDSVKPQIRQLVVNSIPNIAVEKIAIVVVTAQPLLPALSQGINSSLVAGNAKQVNRPPSNDAQDSYVWSDGNIISLWALVVLALAAIVAGARLGLKKISFGKRAVKPGLQQRVVAANRLDKVVEASQTE